MKNLVYGYVIVFVFCFMLFLYEPLIMYGTNVNDFWFDLGIIIGPTLVIFFCSFLVIAIGATLVYLVSKKIFKKECFYLGVLAIFFYCLLSTYIQGNFLIGNLPKLDGSLIDWNVYKIDNIVSIIIYIILFIALIILCRKFSLKVISKYMMYVSIVIFCMLSCSLFSVMFREEVFVKKASLGIVTEDNINNISLNKNFLILLVDAIDGQKFHKIIEEEKKRSIFNDFTSYDNVLAGYPFTQESIPLILTGKKYKNETSFREYYSTSLNDSTLINNLEKKNYDINIYESELIWNEQNGKKISNIKNFKIKDFKTLNFLKQETKYILFKYLPYALKIFSRIETMNFNYCIERYEWNNLDNYKNFINSDLVKQDKNYFQFIHLEGAHYPFNYDENFEFKETGTFEDKIKASINLVDAYLNRLKNNNLYDDSVIVIMSDHGYNINNVAMDRMNPILLLKGFNEKHDLITSDKPIMHEDLKVAFQDLLDGSKSTELFSEIKFGRKRRFLFYEYSCNDNMVEYETVGHATDTKKYIETNNVYKRD